MFLAALEGNPSSAPAPQPINATVTRRDGIMKRISAAFAVGQLSSKCLVLRSDLAALFASNRSLTHLQDSIETHRALIRTERDLGVIAKAHERLAALEAPSALEASFAACNTLREKLRPLCETVQALMKGALDECENLEAEALSAEREMFEAFGLPQEATTLSRRVASVKRQLQSTALAVKMPEPANRFEPCPPSATAFDHAIGLFCQLS